MVGRLLGGGCSPGPLHVHHLVAVEDGGDPYALDNLGTVCATHHPWWEALRRYVVRTLLPEPSGPPRCRHRHVSAAAREQCERRMARDRVAA